MKSDFFLLPPVKKPECVFIASIAFLSFSPWVPGLLEYPSLDTPETVGGSGMWAVWLFIYVTSALIFLFGKRRDHFLKSLPIVLFGLVGWTIISSVWSIQPSLTFQNSAALAGSTFVAIYIASRIKALDFLWLVAITSLLIMVLSVFVVWWHPDQGLDPYSQQSWRGILSHKNSLGRVAGLGALIFAMFSIFNTGRSKLIASIFFAFSILVLLKSDSRTSLAVMISTLLVLCGFRLVVSPRGSRGFVGVLLMLTGFAIALFQNSILMRTSGTHSDIDSLLTGRPTLWRFVLEHIRQAPLQGHGYSGFWERVNATPLYLTRAGIGWNPGSAHNGFLELWLTLGVVGLVLGSMFVIGEWIRVIRFLAREPEDVEGLLVFTVMGWIIFNNVTEAFFLSRNSIYWMLFVVLVVHSRWYLLNRREIIKCNENPLRR